MKVAEKIARFTPERKAQYDQYRAELRERRRERMRRAWAEMTPEQRAERCAKISKARKQPTKVRPGKKVGEAHPRSKLTEAQVRAIHADKRPAKEVAADYGVSVIVVRYIWRGYSWAHLGLPLVDRKDYRRREGARPPKPAPVRLLTDAQELEIDNSPWLDSHELAEKLGVSWFVVATYCQKKTKRRKKSEPGLHSRAPDRKRNVAAGSKLSGHHRRVFYAYSKSLTPEQKIQLLDYMRELKEAGVVKLSPHVEGWVWRNTNDC